MGTAFAGFVALVAAVSLAVPSFLAEPDDAQRLGRFGYDYEGNLCGQANVDGRNLRSLPFMYMMNSTASVCVPRCPNLADEIVCEYPYQAAPTPAKRSQLGRRCYNQRRTRPVFLACMPLAASASGPVDAWLSRHVLDQLAADTLQTSGVVLGCWCAAALCSFALLLLLLLAPQATILASLLATLALALAHGVLLLPYAATALAAARAPADRGGIPISRELASATFSLSAGCAPRNRRV